MATFTLDGVEYPLITLDKMEDLELGELEVLEDVAGISISSLAEDGGLNVTVKVILALVVISMRRVDPSVTVDQARRVKVSVLESLAGEVANTVDEVPPTVPVAPGVPV